MKTFEDLWKYQQGAVFLKQEEIYAHRKNLAEYFYKAGVAAERERSRVLVDCLDKAIYYMNDLMLKVKSPEPYMIEEIHEKMKQYKSTENV